ncbi:MAG: hypothetical protein GC159_18460 [Phycisphaera sp.]|nr:hypothetical protein [Phycisphaera sp.]
MNTTWHTTTPSPLRERAGVRVRVKRSTTLGRRCDCAVVAGSTLTPTLSLPGRGRRARASARRHPRTRHSATDKLADSLVSATRAALLLATMMLITATAHAQTATATVKTAPRVIPELPSNAPSPLPPDVAASSMIVPDGFHVTLFAAEPMVVQPISFAIDDRGRIWVAEGLNYPNRGAEPHDRVLILEDTDGDGAADKSTVFYDKIAYATGIEVGHGGVWIMSPPQMLFIPDRDHDDRPDGEPVVVLDGFGNEHSAHNIVNGFTWGPDGWLYFGHGRTNPSEVGKPGTPADQRIHVDGGVCRYQPVTGVFENYADGTTNPWGVAFDDYGAAFVTNCVTPHVFHMIQGGHYEPWRNRPASKYAYERLPTIADHKHFAGDKWQDSRSGAVNSQLGGGHSHCGAMVYLGDNWPDIYRNDIYTCNVHGHRMNHDHLSFRGSSYVASHNDDLALSRDPWFKGVTLDYGPRGEVYMSDWNDTGECHDYKETHRETGRLFRITYGELNGKPVDIAKFTDAQLVAAQLNHNDWYVAHARRVMQERAAAGTLGKDVAPALRKIFDDNTDVTRKLRALWAMHVIGADDDAFLTAQLGHDSEHVRGWAVQLLCEDHEPPAPALDTLAKMAATEPSPRVRLQLASALQRLPLDKRWAIAEALIGHAEDVDDAYLPLMYWYGIEPLVVADRTRALGLVSRTKIPLIRTFIAKRVVDR